MVQRQIIFVRGFLQYTFSILVTDTVTQISDSRLDISPYYE